MAANAMRIIMLGKTGSGKSSLGNSFGGKDYFKVGRGMRSETLGCQWLHLRRGPDILEIIDTPGLCDTHEPAERIYREVGKSVAVASPGPHIILIALRCDRRFTDEEFMAYKKLKELFSDDMKRFLVIVFNGMDSLGETIPQQKSALNEEIGKMKGGNLGVVLRDANNRFIGMSNKATGAAKEQLVTDIINLMKATVRRNEGKYFTTRIIGDINAFIEGLIASKALKDKVSRFEAERAVKKAIEQEQERAAVQELQRIINGMTMHMLLTEMCNQQ